MVPVEVSFMARFRKPFFKKSHNAWYVTLDGKQTRLAEGETEAFERYHEIMAARKKAAKFVTPGEAAPVALGQILGQFLASGFTGKSGNTKSWYADKLTPFVGHVGEAFTVTGLQPFHVDQWAAAHPDWSSGTIRNLWRAVQRLCRWGHRRGLIPELGILHQEKPRAGKREVVISPDQYGVLLPFIRNDEFRAIVVIAWETGARPQELMAARGRHFDSANARLVFPPEESKDKDRPRIIYLTETALALLKPKTDDPEDHLLKNSEGRPWTPDASLCAFDALYKRMTKAGVKTRKYCLYHLRHSWLDRMLKSGVDALTCAVLMGHKDTSMIAKTYAHLTQSPDYLLAALKRASTTSHPGVNQSEAG